MMLHIRDLDEATHSALKQQADDARRSMSAHAAALLSTALGTGSAAVANRRKILDEAQHVGRLWPRELPAPEDLIAADRSR
jgi:plasmid stability protein